MFGQFDMSRNGGCVIDSSRRVFIEKDLFRFTLCGRLLSLGESFTQNVWQPARLSTVITGDYCEGCKAVALSREEIAA